jgi:integrase
MTTTKTANAKNIAACELWMTEIEVEQRYGTFELLHHFPNAGETTKKNAGAKDTSLMLGDLCVEAMEIWIEENKHVSPNTIRDYWNCVNIHVVPKIGKLRLNIITADDIRKWESKLEATKGENRGNKLTMSKVKNVRTVVRRAYHLAVSRGLINIDNAWGKYESHLRATGSSTKTRTLLADTSTLDPFTKDEMNRIIDSGFELKQDSERNMVAFNFAMGLRMGELIALSWSDIDMEGRTVHVRRQRQIEGFQVCKSASERVLDLTEKAYKALVKQSKITRLSPTIKVDIFTGRTDKQGEAITDQERIKPIFINAHTGEYLRNTTVFSKRWPDVLRRAQVDLKGSCGRTRGPNLMRNTFASMLFTAGATVEEVSRELGNTAETTRKHYAKIIGDSRISTLDKKNAWLNSL